MTESNVSAGFLERLRNAAAVNNSWLMIGLDPVLDRLPDGISRDAEGVVTFNRAIIEATQDLVIGYKPNAAFYEVIGAVGWDALARTRKLISGDLVALLDAKRGDIGTTSEMYAQAIFDNLGFDAATVSPYVGREGIQPFLDRKERGVFVLCRTSNRDGSLQDVVVESGERLYEEVARLAPLWGDNVGLVVGATDTGALPELREMCPDVPFLLPGVGTQGAGAKQTLRLAADWDGNLAVIALSRSIIYASDGRDFADVARARAQDVIREMREAFS